MAHPIRRSELESSLRTYVGYLDDLARIGFDQAATKLRLVVNYARSEPPVHALWELLVTELPNAEFLARAKYELVAPPEPLTAFAHAHQLLAHLKQGHKLNLREVLTRAELSQGGGGLDERWQRLVNQFVSPYLARVEALQAWIGGRGREEQVDAQVELALGLRELFGASSAGSSPPSAEVADASDSSARESAEVDLKLAQLELRKRNPDPTRLAELRRDLRAFGWDERVAWPTRTAGAPAAAPAAPEEEEEDAEHEARVERLGRDPGDFTAAWARLEAAKLALAGERAAFEAERAAFRAAVERSKKATTKKATTKQAAIKKATTKKAGGPGRGRG